MLCDRRRKLSDEGVALIVSGDAPAPQLAAQLCVSVRTIYHVREGRTHKRKRRT